MDVTSILPASIREKFPNIPFMAVESSVDLPWGTSVLDSIRSSGSFTGMTINFPMSCDSNKYPPYQNFGGDYVFENEYNMDCYRFRVREHEIQYPHCCMLFSEDYCEGADHQDNRLRIYLKNNGPNHEAGWVDTLTSTVILYTPLDLLMSYTNNRSGHLGYVFSNSLKKIHENGNLLEAYLDDLVVGDFDMPLNQFFTRDIPIRLRYSTLNPPRLVNDYLVANMGKKFERQKWDQLQKTVNENTQMLYDSRNKVLHLQNEARDIFSKIRGIEIQNKYLTSVSRHQHQQMVKDIIKKIARDFVPKKFTSISIGTSHHSGSLVCKLKTRARIIHWAWDSNDFGRDFRLEWGPFEIMIDLDRKTIKVGSYSDTKRWSGEHYIHPHITGGGDPCWGDNLSEISHFLKEGDLYQIVMFMDRYLDSIYPPSWYAPALLWDKSLENKEVDRYIEWDDSGGDPWEDSDYDRD
ncbi:hypothetical protein LCGC14_0145100 [marine sediment metagenome]|uniref:Uncharacterized protein n=1 Tax=marine sediment metagenome TaxID=412755 RepID=A0A0F9Y193_9ZZZZ